MHHDSQFNLIRHISAISGATGMLWLLAIGEGHTLFLSAEFGTVLASALTSAGLAVSAGMWVMNLIIDKKLSEFDKDYLSLNYMSIAKADAVHDKQDERYGWIREQLEELKNGQANIQSQIEKLLDRPATTKERKR